MRPKRPLAVGLLALALCCLGAGEARSVQPRPLPGGVEALVGVGTLPSARPWNPPVGGARLAVALPDALGELKPYPFEGMKAEHRAPGLAAELLEEGLNLLAKDKLDEAAYAFTSGMRAGEITPAVDECAFWLGEVRLRKGAAQAAMSAYARVRGPLAGEARYRLARLSERAGEAREAEKLWRETAETAGDPHRPEAFYRLGEFEEARGERKMALSRFVAAAESAGEGSDLATSALYRVAVNLREEGRFREAERALSTLFLTRPDHPAATAARVLQGWILIGLGRDDQARKTLRAALREPDLPEEVRLRAVYATGFLALRGEEEAEYSRCMAELALNSRGPWAGWLAADRGGALLAAGRVREALDAYRQAFALWRGEGEDAARFAVGEAQARLGELREAAQTLLSVAPGFEAAPEALARAGELLDEAGEGRAALEVDRKLLEQYPAFPARDGIRLRSGLRLIGLGEKAEAARVLEALPPGARGRETLLFLRGEAAFEAGRAFEAAQLLESYERSGGETHLGRSLALHARASQSLGDVTGAAALYLRASRLAPDPVAAAEMRFEGGNLLLSVGDGEGGAVELTKLLAQSPPPAVAPKAHFALAQFRYDHGDHAQALGHYSAARASGESELAAQAAKGEGAALFALGRFEESIRAYAPLGDDPDGLWATALASGELGRVVEMAAAAAKFAALYPDDPLVGELELKLADTLVVEGRSAEAAGYYEKAAGHLKGARRERAQLMRGYALESLGRGSEARALFQELAKRAGDRPTRAAAVRKLASIELAEGRGGEAVLLLKGALAEAEGGQEVEQGLLNDIAEASLASGDLEGGLEALRRASALGEGEERLRTEFLLGSILEKSGKVSAALETFVRIAYHYDPAGRTVSEAALRGAGLLLREGRAAEAADLYRRVAEGGAPPLREKARSALESLGGGERKRMGTDR